MHSTNIDKFQNDKKKILILGATGFIGRNLAQTLCANEQYSVTLANFNSPQYEIDNATWVNADLRNFRDVNRIIEPFDVIVQAAATTSGSSDIVNSPEIHVTDNAVMNSILLREAFHKQVKHIIFFSCTTMYKSDSQVAQKEEDFNENLEIFPSYFGVAITKLYIEKLCKFYSSISNTKFTVIRHTNTYGPFDKYDLKRSHVMGASIAKVMQADREVTVWGNGEEIRDLLYVGDLMELVESCINKQKIKFLLINAGSEIGVSVKDLVKKIVELSGKQIKILFDESKPTIKYSFISDCTKAFKSLNWRARTSLDEGILKSLEWWKINEKKF
jgi:nucleoside-diphosphate-sugar epimerase